MEHQEIDYCAQCSLSILAEWRGWPHKDAVPQLPRLGAGKCKQCGNDEALDNSHITWFNYHSEHSTGLPDYWLLVVDSELNDWGKPYYAESTCSRCDTVAIISEMNFPNGKHELKVNCSRCGVQGVTPNKQSY